MFVIAILAGTVVSALAVIALKRWAAEKPAATRGIRSRNGLTRLTHYTFTALNQSADRQKEQTMPERTATVASRVGLHARPAAIFAEAAGEFDLDITIAR